jgi:predicted MFS family arabinose efflux permease
VPFVFAAIAVKGAAHDASGRVMAAANLAFAFGLAIGPMVAGEIIDAQGLNSLFPCALAGLASVAALTWRVAR